MPVYDFKCTICGKFKLNELTLSWEEKVLCCGEPMLREFPLTTNVYSFPSEGITLEHVGPKPVTFHSKSEMRRFAKDKNLELGALL